MLQELDIRDFAIIEKLNIAFQTGMTVLTGETGAGKSIIIDAVGVLAGGRGSQDFIRKGANKARLQGLFHLPAQNNTFTALDKYGIDHPDNDVLLQRDLYRSGRNICRVNGQLVNTTTLKEIGETLVDIHGQNEHQELMHPEKHLALLDEFDQAKIAPKLAAYQRAYKKYQHLHNLYQDHKAHAKEWAQRLDMLRFQVDEINAAQLKPDEEANLESERQRLTNFQRITTALNTSYAAIAGDEAGTMDHLGTAMTELQQIASLDPAYQQLADSVQNAYYTLQDTGSDILRQADLMEWDEGRLNEIENRLEAIRQLKRKYGDSIPQILSYYDNIKQELEKMEATENNSDQLTTQVKAAKSKLLTLGKQLSQRRQQSAKKLSQAIHQQLAALYMAKTVFSVRFKEQGSIHFYPTGLDDVEFYVQTNPGEAAGPLAKIASGGELSRMMLALKTIFTRSQGITSIIFDEVDTGVSGRVAQAIADKISGIARFSQVLCITHLPQVAAMSDQHFFIRKQISKQRTKTTLVHLKAAQRVDELARMLAGTAVTKLTREHAQELLQLANQEKRQLQTDQATS
ncbi:DNA repair protein RecN [Loigolactobacillus rennini]|uniref:DNA repair protein RecN n=1 Tax=Loigolactobacillus rennini DSM 20253 TaxID=1423796 RepID=A0A0R2D6J0_9LACO|nr:DNA repair protein RecN [Loigolactobacillus rennini]KRM99521.1 DNA repair protein RecN [Loigolactobacillus rennini DSM 20253]